LRAAHCRRATDQPVTGLVLRRAMNPTTMRPASSIIHSAGSGFAATEGARRHLPAAWLESGKLELAAHQYDAVASADALALVTEWKPFRHPDFDAMKKLMRMPIIFDGRNEYDPRQVRAAGFEYFGIGRS